MTSPQPSSSQDRSQIGMKTIVVSIATNIILAVVKITAGILGNSYALIADGIESTMDIFSSAVVWSGLKIGSIPPDRDHPFGHGKAETLSALVVSLALMGAAAVIAYQSIRELGMPKVPPAAFTLIILVGVVITKEFLHRYVMKVGTEVGSLSVKIDAWHSRSDAITSAAAFIGISIAILGGPRYASADDWAALLASAIIAFNSIHLLRSAVAEIMDSAPDPAIENRIRQIAAQVSGVVNIEKCRVLKSGINMFVDIHVEVDGDIAVRAGHAIAHAVKGSLIAAGLGIVDVLVHIEPAGEN